MTCTIRDPGRIGSASALKLAYAEAAVDDKGAITKAGGFSCTLTDIKEKYAPAGCK
jgi:type IV pilus assembly protein PilA